MVTGVLDVLMDVCGGEEAIKMLLNRMIIKF
jgi:hypothetical protein